MWRPTGTFPKVISGLRYYGTYGAVSEPQASRIIRRLEVRSSSKPGAKKEAGKTTPVSLRSKGGHVNHSAAPPPHLFLCHLNKKKEQQNYKWWMPKMFYTYHLRSFLRPPHTGRHQVFGNTCPFGHIVCQAPAFFELYIFRVLSFLLAKISREDSLSIWNRSWSPSISWALFSLKYLSSFTREKTVRTSTRELIPSTSVPVTLL